MTKISEKSTLSLKYVIYLGKKKKKEDIFHQKSALADFSVILAPDKLQHSSLQLSNPVILQRTVQSEF